MAAKKRTRKPKLPTKGDDFYAEDAPPEPLQGSGAAGSPESNALGDLLLELIGKVATLQALVLEPMPATSDLSGRYGRFLDAVQQLPKALRETPVVGFQPPPVSP